MILDRVDYEKELFPYYGNQRRRTTKVTAVFKNGFFFGERPALDAPLSLYPNGNKWFTPDEIPFGMDRGHLIAHTFGGSSASENIVPMYAGFNRVEWKQFETNLMSDITLGPLNLKMIIECQYDDLDRDPRTPVRFKVTKSINGTAAIVKWFIPTPPSPQRVLDVSISTLLRDYTRQFLESDWRIEDHISDPSGLRLNVPPNGDRPYAILDYLFFGGIQFEGLHYRPKNTQEFSEAQIHLIKAVNRARNNGFMFSDDPTDTAYSQWQREYTDRPGKLIEGHTKLMPEVDHMWPKSFAGSNAFSNASLVSSGHNNTKRAEVSDSIIEASQGNRRSSKRLKI